MKKKITISIDERILELIKKKAGYENRTVSNYIEKTIYKAEAKDIKSFPEEMHKILLQQKEVDT